MESQQFSEGGRRIIREKHKTDSVLHHSKCKGERNEAWRAEEAKAGKEGAAFPGREKTKGCEERILSLIHI